jgi:hypothetical protein
VGSLVVRIFLWAGYTGLFGWTILFPACCRPSRFVDVQQYLGHEFLGHALFPARAGDVILIDWTMWILQFSLVVALSLAMEVVLRQTGGRVIGRRE